MRYFCCQGCQVVVVILVFIVKPDRPVMDRTGVGVFLVSIKQKYKETLLKYSSADLLEDLCADFGVVICP